jgi:Clostripain family
MMEDRMTNGNANWLIMVYISADGLLANFAVESLKQLKRAAGGGVVVMARLDTNGITPSPTIYVFDGSDAAKPLSDSKPGSVPQTAGEEAPNPDDLREFIDNAVDQHPEAKRHALFLWGHGPELLSDEGPKSEAEGAEEKKNSGKRIRKYLTPSDLKEALSGTQLAKKKKIDILGLDACSMSIVEVASELGEHVQFMVASQDDVPDLSFPYGDILPLLSKIASPADASTMIPEVYRRAYLDYIATPRTGFRAITLSAVNLDKDKMRRVTAALSKLSRALLQLSSDETAGSKILDARRNAQGFVFGLFVDIVDLCDRLDASKIDSDLKDACAEMRDAVKGAVITNATHRNPPDNKVTADGKVQGICGLSIYFPYRIPDSTEKLQVLRKGSGVHPTKERTERIQELERDFAALKEFDETGWNKFIQQGWSSILAKEAKARHLVLDDVYSAQQCAQNLGFLRQEVAPSREHKRKPPGTARPGAYEKTKAFKR